MLLFFFFSPQNQIEKIENLDCFPNLRFLSLAGNRIRRVENLQPLRQLRVLDLSHNQIQTLDPEELPRDLRLLDLTGNECTRQHGYRWVRGAGGGEQDPQTTRTPQQGTAPQNIKYSLSPPTPNPTNRSLCPGWAGGWAAQSSDRGVQCWGGLVPGVQ
uniref:Leucine rich repeat containing 46 n=1 Tax=Strix occidentalis caurina TaxID=311401 RepID=A0A8D0F6D1_STROC